MKRNTRKCPLCDKDISLPNFDRHYKAHQNHPENYTQRRTDLTCVYCGNIYKSVKSVVQHEIRCKNNPNRINVIINNFNSKGSSAWNKGLNKYTDYRVNKNSEANQKTAQSKLAAGWKPYFSTNEYWTSERRKERSESKKKFYNEHPEKHPSRIVAHNKKTASYLELIVKDWLEEHNITYIHQYRTQFKDNFRIVDFYLPQYALYIEVDRQYWHANSKDIDEQKDIFAKEEQNIKTLRLSSQQRIQEELDKYFRGVCHQ